MVPHGLLPFALLSRWQFPNRLLVQIPTLLANGDLGRLVWPCATKSRLPESITKDNGTAEGQARLGTVPTDEFNTTGTWKAQTVLLRVMTSDQNSNALGLRGPAKSPCRLLEIMVY